MTKSVEVVSMLATKQQEVVAASHLNRTRILPGDFTRVQHFILLRVLSTICTKAPLLHIAFPI